MATLVKKANKPMHSKMLRKKETFVVLSLLSSIYTYIHCRFHKSKDNKAFTMEVVSEDEIRDSRPSDLPYVL